ncbi:MAG: hypothetical protein ACO3A2_11130 [Bdellovibrionia bacterium]
MQKQMETEDQNLGKKSKKKMKETDQSSSVEQSAEPAEVRALVKIVFEGEAAQKILKCEAELKDRLSKPDMGKILGQEILSWTDKRWLEIIEENTEIDYFFAQIRKCPDRSKSIKLLKGLSEKLKTESLEIAVPAQEASAPVGLPLAASAEEEQSQVS